MRAKEFVPASKPRNFVAKNQKTAGAGAHKDKKRAEKQGDFKHKKKQIPMEGLREFSPAGSGMPPRGPKTPGRDPWGGDDRGRDPYSRPEPEYYSRSVDFFGKFEADHFDDEEFDKKTGVFKGYWDDEEGRVQIAYFKFDDPTKTGSDDPGMGWYYEPQNESMGEDAETPDRETHLVKKLGRLGERIVQNPKLWAKYSEAVDNDDNDWIISLIQEGTGADKSEVMKLSRLFGEIGSGLGRITDFAWAVKEGTWEKDFLKPYLEYKKSKGMEEGSVMEYETHRYTDDQGNEWEVDDEGNRELISRGGGRSGSSGYTYRKRSRPAYSKPKGYYFYNVPAGKESDARAAGLRQSKSGKWFDTMTNSAAEKAFGKGRYWEPKN